MKHNIYASFSKKIDVPIPKYVKDYNPFHIKLDIEGDELDYDENDN
jgi:YbbR domain-containing protein